jgi:uncharacterized protein (TIGR02145 family)
MRTKLNRKGVAGYAPTIAASILLAMVFTFISCANNGNENNENGGGGEPPSNINYTDKGNSISSYKTVKIGEQTWMAENLNYNVLGSKCYGEGETVYNGEAYVAKYSPKEIQANCDKYGRLYDWATAMALPSSCNSNTCSEQINAKRQGICPSGWHIPSYEEWGQLIYYVIDNNINCNFGNIFCAHEHLRATSGWDYGNGLDTYNFSVLPGGKGGYSDDNGGFGRVGNEGNWWEADESSSWAAYRECISGSSVCMYYGTDKSDLLSVRCVMD